MTLSGPWMPPACPHLCCSSLYNRISECSVLARFAPIQAVVVRHRLHQSLFDIVIILLWGTSAGIADPGRDKKEP
eukprot:4981888-Pyramimonas_sp.AAC.1